MNKTANQGIRWLLAVCATLVLGLIVLGQTTSPKVLGSRMRYRVVPSRSWESGYKRPVASSEFDLKRQLLEEYLNKMGQEGWVFKQTVKDHSNNVELYVFERLD